MKTKKYFLILTIILGVNFYGNSQDKNAVKETPVTNSFNSGVFMENQTYLTNYKHAWEFVVNHRFGKISDGSKMAWGIYSPSNIRVGVNYSITKDIQIGIGTTKNDKLQDGSVKWNFLHQTQSGKMPISLTYYGSLVYDARDTKSFAYSNFKESHRFSYFHELIIARKFHDKFSLQVAPIYTHYNVVESASDTMADPVRKNDNFGISALGRLSLSSTLSLMVEYDQNFTKLVKETSKFKNPKPVISIGFEKATTSEHSFQLFLSSGEAIAYQKNMVYNQNNFWNGNFVIGFNITRVF
ncbi:MAG: hypothetical protein HXX09_05570 [Bacteroidetes bacterium]|nr:hypothetical protein [Bacteroidota bacterium]